MFCTEERVLSANKMREIKIGPVPISNVSCFNDNVWEAIGRPGLEAVIKTSILAILALATVLANLIFILVLRSNKFRRHAHVQVWDIPCIARVMVRITLSGGVANVSQRATSG